MDYYGFFESLDSFINEIEVTFQLQIGQGKDRLLIVLNELKLLKGKKLLIIDNIKEVEENRDTIEKILELSINSDYKILMTSREKIEDIESYFLNVLNLKDATNLFKSFYKKKVEDESLITDIVKYLDYHSLFIELTAKTLLLKKRTLSLEEIVKNFSEKEFTTIKRNDITSYHKFLDNFSINDVILKNKENLLFIKKISILPSIEISFEDLYKFLVCDDKDELEELIIILVRNGWLIEFRNGYKFHQILQDYILEKHTPHFNDIEKTFSFFNEKIENSTELLTAIENKKYSIYLDSIANFLSNLNDEENNESIGVFLNNVGLVDYYLGEYKKAKEIFFQTLKFFKKLSKENFGVASCYSNLGMLYQTIGEYNLSEEYIFKSLSIHKRWLHEEDSKIIVCYYNLGELYKQKGDYTEAEIFYIKALKINERVLGEEHLDTATTYHGLSTLYRKIGLYEKSESFILKSLKIKEKLLGEEHPLTSISYSNLAELYKITGKYEKAEIFYLKDLHISEKKLGTEHINTAESYNNIAIFYRLLGKYKKSESFYVKALNIKEKLLEITDPSLAKIYSNLATLYTNNKEYIKAEPLSLKALKHKENALGINHDSTALSYNNLGALYYKMERYQEAEIFQLKGLEIRKKTLGNIHPSTAESYNNLGALYNTMKLNKEAEFCYLKSLEINEKNFREDNENIGTNYHNLSLIYYDNDEMKKAYTCIKRATEIREKVLPKNHHNLIDSQIGLQGIINELHQQMRRKDTCYCGSNKKYKNCCGK